MAQPPKDDDPDFAGEKTPATNRMVRPPPKDAPPWMDHAWAEYKLGVHEVAGPKANPRILEYFKATNLGMNPIAYSDETPWCSAFACFVMEQTGIASTKSASARSWMNWGTQAPVPPQYGAITVFWRGNPRSMSGHVGFFVGAEGSNLWILGGNQFNSVSFAKYPRMRLLGYRMPK